MRRDRAERREGNSVYCGGGRITPAVPLGHPGWGLHAPQWDLTSPPSILPLHTPVWSTLPLQTTVWPILPQHSLVWGILSLHTPVWLTLQLHTSVWRTLPLHLDHVLWLSPRYSGEMCYDCHRVIKEKCIMTVTALLWTNVVMSVTALFMRNVLWLSLRYSGEFTFHFFVFVYKSITRESCCVTVR